MAKDDKAHSIVWIFPKTSKISLFTYNAKTLNIIDDAADLKKQVYLQK